MSYLCNRCSGWVHSKCSGLQNAAEYRRIKDWVCSSCNSPPTLPKLQPPPIPTQAVDGNSFTIMQFNANGIGNKLTELGEFLKRHNVIQKLTITATLGETELIITNVTRTGDYLPSLDHLMMTTDTLMLGDFNATTRCGTQARQIREAPYWRMWYLALTLVFLIGIHQQGYQATSIHLPQMSH